MGAYQFETFDADTQARPGLNGLRSDILEKERNDAYAKGFKNGVDITNDALETERNKLLAAISEMLADRAFTYEEACQNILRSVAPVLDAVVRRTAPTLAGTTFHATITELVTTACKRAISSEARLEVPAGQGAALSALLAERHPNLNIVESPEHGPREARILWEGGVDHIDMDAIVAEIDAKLTEFQQSVNEGNDERARDAG